jgi:hypothetical protein
MQDVNPLQFWKMLYNITPLSKIALKILSAPCTSAATERTFLWIYNKRRNRLTTERASKLTTCHTFGKLNFLNQNLSSLILYTLIIKIQ